MDTFDAMENTNDHKNLRFETELLERFFDHKSYYLHGFMNHLKNNETTLEDPLETVAVGLLVDEIINASNKTEKLRQLERFDQYNFYRQQLSEGIKYLESSKLSTQQMMDIVDSLGKSFAETLVTIVTQQDSRNYLLRLVGLEEGSKKSDSKPQILEPEPPVLKEKFTSDEKRSIHENPWEFFKKDINKKIEAIQDLILKLEKNSNSWETFKQIKNGYKDLRDWSMIQGDQGIEAISHKILLLFEVVFVRAPEKRSLIIPILHDAIEIIQTINNIGPGSEGLDIVRVMAHQIDKERTVFPETVTDNKIEEQSSEEKKEESTIELPPLENQVEEKNEAFEYEDNVEKNLELLEEHQEDDLIIEKDDLPLPENFVETLKEDEEKEKIKEDDSFDQEFSEYINEFNIHRDEQNVESNAEFDSNQENYLKEKDAEDLETFDSIRDSEMLSELVTENADRLDEIEFPELNEIEATLVNSSEKEDDEISDVTLPGEDDQSLIDLISEIESEKNGQEDYNFDTDFEEKKQEAESKNEENSNPVNQNFSTRFHTQKIGNGADFVEEADMYFSFAKKALQNLMKNSSDRQALEDMELACYSLKTIGDKLGYRQVGKMMGFAENFIQKRIYGENGLRTDQINTLFSIVDELEKSGSEKSFTLPDRRQWFSNQELTLKNWISKPSSLSEKKMQAPFQNTDKKSSVGKIQSEDPLDFLLFDDTSKYFRQLLKD